MPRQTVPSSVLLRGRLKVLVPLLRDGVAWRVRNYVTVRVTSDLADLTPSERRRALSSGAHGGEPALARHDVLARRYTPLHAARSTEHLLFIEGKQAQTMHWLR